MRGLITFIQRVKPTAREEGRHLLWIFHADILNFLLTLEKLSCRYFEFFGNFWEKWRVREVGISSYISSFFFLSSLTNKKHVSCTLLLFLANINKSNSKSGTTQSSCIEITSSLVQVAPLAAHYSSPPLITLRSFGQTLLRLRVTCTQKAQSYMYPKAPKLHVPKRPTVTCTQKPQSYM